MKRRKSWPETYHLCTRVIFPLAMLYAAGVATGQLLYYKTGHFGLLWGPLGELHATFLRGIGPRFYASGWRDGLHAAVFVAIFLAETRRMQGRKAKPSASLLQVGYLLAAMSTIAPMYFGRSRAWEAPLVAMLLAGTALGAGAWARWSAMIRACAIALLAVGMVVGVWIERRRDRARLAAPQGVSESHRNPRGERANNGMDLTKSALVTGGAAFAGHAGRWANNRRAT